MTAKLSVLVDDLPALVHSCVLFYKKNKDRMNSEQTVEKRAKISAFAEAFHRDSGTLTASVNSRLGDLKNGNGLVLMTAHQPNLFVYSGVLRKATLSFVLAQKLEYLLKIPVVSFFGIADQDFTDDRWVRSCQIPAVKRNGGILSLKAKLPNKLILNRVPKPDSSVLEKWRAEIVKWLNEEIASVERLSEKLGDNSPCPSTSAETCRDNFEHFWKIAEDCCRRAKNYSDFNSFVMSRIINGVWEYDTLFSRFSECQQLFADEFAFLISHFDEYSRPLEAKQTESFQADSGNGVSAQEAHLVPFWYHCECGGKVRLLLEETDGSIFGMGNCLRCGEHYCLELGPKNNPRLSSISSRISARAISMCIVFFKGLIPSCYIGGVAGIEYLQQAGQIAERLDIPFPPIATWRPHDAYLGLGQLEAKLELRRICKGLGVEDLSSARSLLESRLYTARRNLDSLESLRKNVLAKLKHYADDIGLKKELKEISMRKTRAVRTSNLPIIIHELKTLENILTVQELIPSIIDYAINVGLKETSDQWVRQLGENGNLSSTVHLESVLNGNNQDYKYKRAHVVFP